MGSRSTRVAVLLVLGAGLLLSSYQNCGPSPRAKSNQTSAELLAPLPIVELEPSPAPLAPPPPSLQPVAVPDNCRDPAERTALTEFLSSLPAADRIKVTIACDPNGKVSKFTAVQINLSSVPSFVFSFSALVFLDVSYNRFNLGPLPDFHGLNQLEHLNLSIDYETKTAGFGFGGPLESSKLPRSLKVLRLSGNRLGGGLPDFSSFAQLTELTVDDTYVSGTNQYGLRGPIDVSRLPKSLIRLTLTGSALGGPVPDFSAFTNLQRLLLYNNFKKDIPDSGFRGSIVASQLPLSLIEFNIGGNALSGSFPDVSSLTKLESLSLGGREPLVPGSGLTGPLSPAYLPKSLTDLSAPYNYLSGELPDFSQLPKLRGLTLFGNYSADVSGSGFRGPILPQNFPPSIEVILLNENILSGTLGDFSRFPKLRTLWLHSNYRASQPNSGLRGEINRAFLPVVLEQLLLMGNAMGGPLPDLSGFQKLTSLRLENNYVAEIPGSGFTGVLNPDWLPASLNQLLVDGNLMSGRIPNMSKFQKMANFGISSNYKASVPGSGFSGPLPASLNLPKLTSCYLGGNPLCPGKVGICQVDSGYPNSVGCD